MDDFRTLYPKQKKTKRLDYEINSKQALALVVWFTGVFACVLVPWLQWGLLGYSYGYLNPLYPYDLLGKIPYPTFWSLSS